MNQVLTPFFHDLIPTLKGKTLTMDFRGLQQTSYRGMKLLFRSMPHIQFECLPAPT